MARKTKIQLKAEVVVQDLRDAAHHWASLPVEERARRLQGAGRAILSSAEELSCLLSEETGRPLTESYAIETVGVSDLFSYWCKRGPELLRPRKGQIPALDMPGKSGLIERRPRGVVGVIAPWNYPVVIPMRAIVPALLAGNTVALKPSEVTPATGLWLVEKLRSVLGPVVGILEGDGRAGNALIKARPDMIVFTGSTATGRKVAVECAKQGIPCEAELGGKDCAVVLEDAPLERAAAGIAWGILHNGGQDCASIERVVVHARIAELFERALVQKMRSAADFIPDLATEKQKEIVVRHIKSAVDAGGTILTGGLPEGDGPVPPTLIRCSDRSCAAWTEESFGPLAILDICGSDDDLMEAANDTSYGLGTSIWTQDFRRGEKLARRAKSGMAWVNNHGFSAAVPDLPWVGASDSGTGITNSPEALFHLTVPRLIVVDRAKGVEPWWYPYSDKMLNLMRAAVERQRKGGVRATLKTLKALRARGKELS